MKNKEYLSWQYCRDWIILKFDIVECRFKMRCLGAGKGQKGWFKLERVSVSYDHPSDARLDHTLNIDFVNEKKVLVLVLRSS